MKRYNVRILPSKLSGTIEAIPSKSAAHRILIASALASSPTKVRLTRLSDDINATVSAMTALGAAVSRDGDIFTVTPSRLEPTQRPRVFCSECGTTSRLIMPVLAALCDGGVIDGSGSLLKRPFDELCRVLAEHGVSVSDTHLPIELCGRLTPGEYSIRGDISSQYISALMMALPLLSEQSRIVLTTPLASSAYVDMTRRTLADFGVYVGDDLVIRPQRYVSPGYVEVEGDASNAAFFRAMGVRVTGIPDDTLQADETFLSICENDEISVDQCPDLAPVLAVYACMKNGRTRLLNVERLRIKESDRVSSILAMIGALGGRIEADEHSITIYGNGQLCGGVVDSFADHRIVMAAAVAATICQDEVLITNAQAVEKSYPDFFDDYNGLGGKADVKFFG